MLFSALAFRLLFSQTDTLVFEANKANKFLIKQPVTKLPSYECLGASVASLVVAYNHTS